MFEAILVAAALAGSPAAAPAPALNAVVALVAADEAAATDELPSLDELARLPGAEEADASIRLLRATREWLTDAKDVGAINVDAAIAETDWRLAVWSKIKTAHDPLGWSEYAWVLPWETSSMTRRRMALADLRLVVGDEVYFAGAWPAPSPFISRYTGGRK